MDALRTILPRVLHRRGLHTQARASLVTHAAQQWIMQAAPHLADLVRVERFSHATIQIACTHSVAAQECHALLPVLQEYLQRMFRKEKIEGIRMVRERKKR